MPCLPDRPRRTRIALTALSALTALAAASALPAHAAGAPDPLDPGAKVPPLRHQSAFAGYRPLPETAVGSWKDANEAVARAGGWRAYAREGRPAPGGAGTGHSHAAPGASPPAAPGASPGGSGAGVRP
ncbi:MAG: hypothetical protein KGQ67_08315 [Betaproteobacteria bacterium]|nr:hypothetical protein [Betaproteobacteria bacterium]